MNNPESVASTNDTHEEVRNEAGAEQKWIPSVAAIVLRDSPVPSDWAVPEVLLVKRADNGVWTPVTGKCEPGEDPHDAAVREVLEETGVAVTPAALLGVGAFGPITFDNGVQASYMSVQIRLDLVDPQAEPRVNDDENTETGWFPISQMPVEYPKWRLAIADAAAQRRHPASFQPRLGLSKR
ncbi:NUDIX domain-containing protein [Corynebacterium sp. LK2510]|uniref:NUDIX domain-containing protein n=1 Tax=Corynebacterium sp. LK2510 TaxID=3110472 RepID=UPI0034CECAAB